MSQTTKRTQDQHYVPRLHLRQSCSLPPERRVFSYSKSRGDVRPSRVEETGFKKNFYSIRDRTGAYVDGIDDKLTEIENKAQGAYQRMLKGEIPTGQARADFAVFIATCYSRSPAIIRAYAEAMARTAHLELRLNTRDRSQFDRLTDKMEREEGTVVSNRDEVFGFINDPTRYTIGISEKRGLQAISIADKIAPTLYHREWTILEADAGFFITSDNPVVRWVPEDARHSLYGDGGFNNRRAEVTFPLSSRFMLVMGESAISLPGTRVSRGVVHQWNRMRAANAEDMLFAKKNDPAILALSEEFRDERPRLSIGHPLANEVEIDITR